MPGVLQDHQLEDNEPLCILVVLPKLCQFCGQCVHKSASNSATLHVITPCGHDRQRFPSRIPVVVGSHPPTEVQSIVGVYPISINLLDPPVLPRGYVTVKIPQYPLVVFCVYLLLRSRCFRCPCLSHFFLICLCSRRHPSTLRRFPDTPLFPVCRPVLYL